MFALGALLSKVYSFIKQRTYISLVVDMDFICSIGNRTKLGSGVPGPKKVPRGSKSSSFALGICSSSTFKKCCESNKGTFRLTHSISDVPVTPSCSLRSLESEVAVM